MEVISCRINADWDAIGALVVVRKLYPGALIVAPPPQDTPAMREAGSILLRNYKLRTPDGIDPADVHRLVLVATRRAEEIGDLRACLENPACEVHLYDNHTALPDDIQATLEVIQPLGSCITILVQLLLERDLKLMPDEATWALFGIHEQTGGLLFPTTTAADLAAAAALLNWGADLEAAAEMRRRVFSIAQTLILHDLLQSLRRFQVGNREIVLAEANTPSAATDWPACVDRLHQMRGGSATLAFVVQDGNAWLAGRSRAGGVDLHPVAALFGGAGEATAVNLPIRGMTIAEAERRLREILPELAEATPAIRRLLTGPAPAAGVTTPLRDVQLRLRQTGLAALPIVDAEGRWLNLAEREVVENAVRHGLADWPVERLLGERPRAFAPETGLDEAFDIAVRCEQSLFPVVEEGKAIGLLSRADLYRETALAHRVRRQPAQAYSSSGLPGRENLAAALAKALPPAGYNLLRQLGALAAERRSPAQLVGGIVRDLVLRRANLDIDVVVDGDAGSLAQEFAERQGGKATRHEEFNTATVRIADFRIDLAMARRDEYERPGARPRVVPASPRQDALRRDFTINTLLLDLSPDRFGVVTDFCEGLDDLRQGCLRVLHGLSFLEDPTRLFRAVRFAGRFGFHLAPATQDLFRRAIADNFVDRVEGSRLWKEMTLILEEADPAPILTMLFEEHLAQALHPKLKAPPEWGSRCEQLGRSIRWRQSLPDLPPVQPSLVWWGLLLHDLTRDEGRDLAARLQTDAAVIGDILDRVAQAKALADALQKIDLNLPADAVACLRHAPAETALLAAALTDRETAQEAVYRYYSAWHPIKTEITGDDLQKMGLEPGPIFKKILDEVLAARLNGQISTKRDELLLAKKIWRTAGEAEKASPKISEG